MWPNPQESADLVTFTEEILHEKLQKLPFLCSEWSTGTAENQFSNYFYHMLSQFFYGISYVGHR